VRNSQWSLFLYRGGKLRALYDLRSDPAQQHNVIDQHPETAAVMLKAFQTFARTQTRPLAQYWSPEAAAAAKTPQPSRQLSGKARRELKALGYLQ